MSLTAEHEEILQETFPFMLREVPESERHNAYQQFGFELCDGWYQLIYDLCAEITARYTVEGLAPDVQVLQVKEKFGTLRFYYTFPGERMGVHAFDSMSGGGFRFFPKGNEEEGSLHSDIAVIVRKYEKLSGTVCEKCGKPGGLRRDLRWIRTLCEDCYETYPRRTDR